ncbi:FecR domain-containing protein [Pseudomonas massiliensis]|uniref:FecR domain-containing protein n=1 Tax=Pseudomonas massiliensis TaxID=522492 RepID=UPI00058BC563|nr:FecR family protein [Pseudomonas massiliensis]
MNPSVSSRALDDAIAWQLTLEDKGNEQARREFERWLAADEEHARAWHRLNLIDLRINATSVPARAALRTPRDGLRRQLRTLGRGLAGVAMAIGLAVVGRQVLPVDYWLADERTQTGEQRLVQLADGTRINLNTHSAIDIRFDTRQRLILLREGEILVDTGHRPGESRPFIVQTRDGTLRPLGTRFMVRSLTQGTLLGVLQASVAAKPRQALDERVVSHGQQLLMNSEGITSVSALPPSADAWTHGMLVADNTRLADLVNELDRYRPGYLSVTPEVANLRITGSFPLTDTDRALRAMLPILPITLTQHSPWWTRIGPREG